MECPGLTFIHVIIESDQVMEWLGESSHDEEEDKDESGMETD